MDNEEAKKEADALFEQLAKNRGTFQAAQAPQPQTAAIFRKEPRQTTGNATGKNRQYLLYGGFILTLIFTLIFFLATGEERPQYDPSEAFNLPTR